MGLSHSPSIVTDGLVLCLDAANRRSYPGSGTWWYNMASGSFNSYVYNGTSFSTGYKGHFVFDGVNDYIQTSPLGAIPSGFSVSSWFYASGGAKIFSTNNSDSTKSYAVHVGSDGKLYFQTWLATQYISNAGVISMDTWYFVTTTQTGVSNEGDQATINVYVNGQNIATVSRAAPTGFGNYTRIGRFNAAYHGGGIASVLCHKKVLSADEVRRNYLATKSRFGL